MIPWGFVVAEYDVLDGSHGAHAAAAVEVVAVEPAASDTSTGCSGWL